MKKKVGRKPKYNESHFKRINQILSDNPGITQTEASKKAGIDISTAHRRAKEMGLFRGYIYRDTYKLP